MVSPSEGNNDSECEQQVKSKSTKSTKYSAENPPPRPHEIHPDRQCEYVNKLTGKRCTQWKCRKDKIIGSWKTTNRNYEYTYWKHCVYHSRHYRNRDKSGNQRHFTQLQLDQNLPRIYARHLTKSLSQALEEQLGCDPQEQLQLYEELALIRDSAGQAVQMYSIAREALSQEPHNEKRQSILAESAAIMRMQLQQVVETCEKAAKIEAMSRDNAISIHQMYFFINQIVRKIHDVLGDSPESLDLVARIEENIRTGVKVPGGQFERLGVNTTPEVTIDVEQMDASIPPPEAEGSLRIVN